MFAMFEFGVEIRIAMCKFPQVGKQSGSISDVVRRNLYHIDMFPQFILFVWSLSRMYASVIVCGIVFGLHLFDLFEDSEITLNLIWAFSNST